MANVTDIFSNLLGSNMDQIQKSLGDNNKNQILSAASAALPAMMEALNKNTNSKEGAESLAAALDKDHDGSKLGNISSMISNYKDEKGSSILNHMFGSNTENVVKNVSQSSGLNAASTTNLMTMLAPLLLEYLGKTKKEQNLDASGISNLTSMASGLLGSKDLLGTITNLLDSDKDGSIIDDATNLITGLFKKK